MYNATEYVENLDGPFVPEECDVVMAAEGWTLLRGKDKMFLVWQLGNELEEFIYVVDNVG